MSEYRLCISGGVYRDTESEGTLLVPFDLDNREFLIYADWLLAGNKPDPIIVPDGWMFAVATPMPFTNKQLKAAIAAANGTIPELDED